MEVSRTLIEECKAGKRQSQNALYQQLLPYLAAVARRYLWDVSFINDCLQETFIALFQHIEKYDESRSAFPTWAVRICVNKCFKQNQKVDQAKVVQLDPEHLGLFTEPEVLKKMSDEDLLMRLRKMPSELYEVFNLYIIDGFKHEEIGEMLSISPQASRKRLSRARKWIQEKSDFKNAESNSSEVRTNGVS